MPEFESNGVNIHFVVEGEAPTAVLVHGFASSPEDNGLTTGFVATPVRSGRGVVALP